MARLVLLLPFLGCASDPDAASSGADGLSAEQRRIKQRLETLGYATATEPAPDASGVTVHRSDLVAAGLNLFTSGHAPAAYLFDMDGNQVHEWRYAFHRAWPQRPRPRKNYNWKAWRYARALDNGDLLAIYEGLGIIRLDRDSNLLWAAQEPAHHDIDVGPNGDIYTLTRTVHVISRINSGEPVAEDYVTVLDGGGRLKDRFSLLEAWERSPIRDALPRTLPTEGDLLHANTLEYFDGSKSHLSPLFERGNILTSFRRLDTIAIVDGESRHVVWALAGDWGGQHYPTLLDDGRILLFVNRHGAGASRVEIIDPTDGSTNWSYSGSPPESFYTSRCGGAQMLPNGNVLITESQDGRVFEVDPDGTIVWEFLNPFRVGGGKTIAYIYLLERYDARLAVGWPRQR